jgi:hypothetical protein
MYVIQGQIINEADNLENRVLAFWTKKGWNTNIKKAIKYTSMGVARNAIYKTQNPVFHDAIKIGISDGDIQPKQVDTSEATVPTAPVAYRIEFDEDEYYSRGQWGNNGSFDPQRHQGKEY